MANDQSGFLELRECTHYVNTFVALKGSQFYFYLPVTVQICLYNHLDCSNSYSCLKEGKFCVFNSLIPNKEP